MREGVAWKSFKGSAILGVDAQMPRTLPQWGGKYGDAGGARRSKAQAGVWPRVRLRASREETSRLVGLKPSRRYLSLLLQDLGTPPPTHTPSGAGGARRLLGPRQACLMGLGLQPPPPPGLPVGRWGHILSRGRTLALPEVTGEGTLGPEAAEV